MFSRNKHLNIFEHYQGAGTLPIENNVSRGFAIILESYPLVLDRFIDYINAKCVEVDVGIAVSKPERCEDFDIGFQQSVKQIVASYSDLSSIIGITLTTTMADEAGDYKDDTNSDLITDIIAVIGDNAVVVEVKRTDENAIAQCQQQVDSLIAELSGERDSANHKTALLSGTWDEIIYILQKSADIFQENPHGILSQYIRHIELRYPQWFPVKKLSGIEFAEDNASAIEKRIAKLAKNSCDDDGADGVNRKWGGYTIPTDSSDATVALIATNYGTKNLEVKIWVADTKRQGYQYFNKLKYDLSWIYEKQLGVDSQSFELRVDPYIRFAHFQSTVFSAVLNHSYYKEELGTDKQNWYNLWKAMSRTWKRDEWSDLTEMLTETYDGAISNIEYRQRFGSNFEDSDRVYVYVSLGFEVTVSIPHSVIESKESVGSVESKSSDALAALVKDIIVELIHKVE